MNNLYIKPQKDYSKREKRFILIIAIIVSAAFFYILYYQNKKFNATIQNRKIIETAIIKVECFNGRGRSRLYFRNYKNEVKHVNVDYSKCIMYRTGNVIAVFIDEENDWYVIDNSKL